MRGLPELNEQMRQVGRPQQCYTATGSPATNIHTARVGIAARQHHTASNTHRSSHTVTSGYPQPPQRHIGTTARR